MCFNSKVNFLCVFIKQACSWCLLDFATLRSKEYYLLCKRLSYLIVNSFSVLIPYPHWTYWLQILSKLCFQRVALSGNQEILAICTDKNTFFNYLDYKADIGQHFHKSEKSARWRHRHKIIKTNLKTHISPLLTRPQGSQGCQKMRQDPLKMPVEVWCAQICRFSR